MLAQLVFDSARGGVHKFTSKRVVLWRDTETVRQPLPLVAARHIGSLAVGTVRHPFYAPTTDPPSFDGHLQSKKGEFHFNNSGRRYAGTVERTFEESVTDTSILVGNGREEPVEIFAAGAARSQVGSNASGL
jgi:hypothetical protein